MGSGTFKSMLRLAQKQNLLTTLRYRLILFSFGLGLLILLFIFFNLYNSKKAIASTESLTTGALVINMGITPQTYNNGLKPYGMLFDLIVNYSVPIKWVIEPSKAKDGNDFIYNAVNYKGGTFIVPSEYINSTISTRISYWQTQGVQGVYTTSPISVPVFASLTAFPISIIDDEAGREDIIIQYYTNAGISSSGYVVGTPSILQDCNDIWVNPHGDPTWATHGYLYNYVTVSKNFIWAECHAVSVIEGVANSVSPFQRLNYLTTNGLKCYSSNKCGTGVTETHAGNPTTPFTHYYPSDPVMQFMGTMDGATDAGSEKWYQPQSTGAWRATTKRLVTTSNGSSPNEGILMAYGPGFGNPANGYVMYEAGHDLDGSGTTAEKVAAQRAFFNFVLLAGITKQLTFSGYTIPNSFKSSENKAVSVSVSSGTAPYSYSWSSTIGGSFTSGTSSSASFTAPNTPVALTGALKCTVIDACGRQNFVSQVVAISENTLPVTLKNISAVERNGNVLINWTTGSELNNDYFTISRSGNAYDFIEIGKVKGAGNSSHDIVYSYIDNVPMTGVNFYRLTQTDFDGKTTLFSPVYVKISNEFENENTILRLSPVPFNDYLRVDFYIKTAGMIDFIIFSEDGRIVKTERLNGAVGSGTHTFTNLNILPIGVYFIIMKTPDGGSFARKVINN